MPFMERNRNAAAPEIPVTMALITHIRPKLEDLEHERE